MGKRRPSEWVHELGGGLGDAGLLIPLAVALITLNGLSATAVFAGVGLAYMGTALYFRVPLPVQPLKAFAAAAIALQLDAATIAAGALLTAMGVLDPTAFAFLVGPIIGGLITYLVESLAPTGGIDIG